jgi:hypothetical protein
MKNKELKKYQRGRKCIVDKGTPWEQPAYIFGKPVKTKFGWKVIVVFLEKVWTPNSWPDTFEKEMKLQVEIARVTLK